MVKTQIYQTQLRTNLVIGTIVTILSLLLSGLSHAQTSLPTSAQGSLNLTISPGSGTTAVPTALSMPLLTSASISGQIYGVITGVTSNTLTNQKAGWSAGKLSTNDSPYLILITSGKAMGRTFLLSTSKANATTTVTLDSSETTDLTALGLAFGKDTYELYSCNTIANLFETPSTSGVLGAATPDKADQIMILSSAGTWNKYYFNTTSNTWREVSSNTLANNVPIPPDSGVIYNRLAKTPLTLHLMGQTPSTQRSINIAKSGMTFLANGWPTDTTLASSAFNQIPGWTSNTNSTKADQVQILRSGVWTKYYHDGTQWRQIGSNAPSNTVILQAGSATMISKLGSATGTVAFTQTPPYSL